MSQERRDEYPGAPPWVRWLAVAAAVVILVAVAAHLTGHGIGGHHLPAAP